MTNTKWLRRALLGGVALGVMATGAHADELAELKAQLEALQSRVQPARAAAHMAALPEGASYLTFQPRLGRTSRPTRPGALNQNRHGCRARLHHRHHADRRPSGAGGRGGGLRLRQGRHHLQLRQRHRRHLLHAALFSAASMASERPSSAHARQTRFGIRSRTDTAIGQIRTQVEGDFFSVRRRPVPSAPCLRRMGHDPELDVPRRSDHPHGGSGADRCADRGLRVSAGPAASRAPCRFA
jgi:hypothetical protein